MINIIITMLTKNINTYRNKTFEKSCLEYYLENALQIVRKKVELKYYEKEEILEFENAIDKLIRMIKIRIHSNTKQNNLMNDFHL